MRLPSQEFCTWCGATDISRVKRVISNGDYQIFDRCNSCGRNANGTKLIPHNGHKPEELETVEDYSKQAPPCERCGSNHGVEYHHWAPRHVFVDAENWPHAWLCRPCHIKWHQAMNKAVK